MNARNPSRTRKAAGYAQPFTDAVLAVFRANGLLLAWGDRFVAPLGLTSARWQMLGALALAGEPLSAPRIAEEMGVTRQGAQKQLDLLVGDGLVERMDNPSHLRSPLYRLTSKGDGVYAKVERRWREHAEAFASQVSAGDIAAARRFLSSLARQLVEEPGERP